MDDTTKDKISKKMKENGIIHHQNRIQSMNIDSEYKDILINDLSLYEKIKISFNNYLYRTPKTYWNKKKKDKSPNTLDWYINQYFQKKKQKKRMNDLNKRMKEFNKTYKGR
jgi:hypothetical protein